MASPASPEEDSVLQAAFDKLQALEDKEQAIAKAQVIAQEQVTWKFEQQRSKELYEPRKAILKELPKFWSQAFGNHPELSSLLEAEDIEAFEALESIDVVTKGKDHLEVMEIVFTFGTNPYFKDKVLTKQFKFDETRSILATSGMKIDWKEGKNLTNQAESAESSDPKKRKIEEVDVASFFMWFEDDNVDTSSLIAATIYDDLWPNAVQYFQKLFTEEDEDSGPEAYELEDDEEDAEDHEEA